MAKRKNDERYERVYERVREVAMASLKELQGSPDGPALVASAQAEAFVRSLRYALRTIKGKYHATYLHNLFGKIMKDALGGHPNLTGMALIVERKKAR